MFEKYNNMSIDELSFEREKVLKEIKELQKEEKRLEKIRVGKLKWWFILPLFGMIVYSFLLSKKITFRN